MAKLKAAIIGCGGRGREHAMGYAASDQVEIVAVVDPRVEARTAAAEKFGVKAAYASHQQMFAEHRPDIVSICTWTGWHPLHVRESAAGVRAIHCEKPMAPTWGEAKAMFAQCEKAGVQLTFCHQRRFGAHFITARRLAMEGAIGKVERMEGFCSNMFDWGTHWFDMFCFNNDETPAVSVLGQIDVAKWHRVFGVPVESSGISCVQFANGVHATLHTGADHGGTCSNRIIGSEGVIEVEVSKGPRVRMLREGGSGWEVPPLEGVVPAGGDTVLSVLDAIACLQSGARSTLGSHNALRSTELIFATYESSRRRGRVTLPLDTDDSALLELLGADGHVVLDGMPG
ncbi:MAG TPA: Gfo/Idh/MocA family oxidoreductase [Chthonomonadaceae bacterium]|nr:Gfo/Idh/MocA family oxidoreductase [Chthonomonadaceae bacterium]